MCWIDFWSIRTFSNSAPWWRTTLTILLQTASWQETKSLTSPQICKVYSSSVTAAYKANVEGAHGGQWIGVSLRRNEDFIYTSVSFSGQSYFALWANPNFVRVRLKSAYPTDTEKSLSTIICQCCRYHSQPLSSASRKQRYNTLDFANKMVCQQGCCSPLRET